MIQIKMIGNWRGASRALNQLPILVKSSAIWGQRKAAEKLVKIVKNHINNQDLDWAPRAESTNAGDNRILVDTGDYLSYIKAWRKDNLYFAGVPQNAYSSRGVRISDYALYNEYGTSSIPARPVWTPSLEELGGKEGIRKIIKTSIYNKIKILEKQGFKIDLSNPLT